MKREDLAGRRFGALVMLEPASSVNGSTRWLCRCDCGTVKAIWTKPVRRGLQKTCGCGIGTLNEGRERHNASRTPEYQIWRGIIDRCTRPKYREFHLYGGRGIAVCARWRNSFVDFITDMGPRPSATHSVDRRDGNGNYEPGNCRWATPLEQGNNMRGNRMLSANGETHTIAEWERLTGITSGLIRARIDRLGWSVERAIGTPTRVSRQVS